MTKSSVSSLPFILLLLSLSDSTNVHDFSVEEATIDSVRRAFAAKKLTSRHLVNHYLHRIESLNPLLRGVLELNPDAVRQAEAADLERETNDHRSRSLLHGIPVLLKDNIATKDEMNTTAGSYALLRSVVPRDAGVVVKLRKAGAVILGKASMSEWANFRSNIPSGWCARGGQGVNPYVEGVSPCGSSSGSAISVAANMVMVSLGTETDGSLICPGDSNSVVAIKPTVGLTSRAGVIPISPRQDTIGPICRTVSDAAYVLDSIVGFDARDFEATKEAAMFIPEGGYTQFLKKDGLKGKRLGVVRNPGISSGSPVYEAHLQTLREKGATILDNLEIPDIDAVLDPSQSGEDLALAAEFKVALNEYLKELVSSPVKSLSDVILFNENNPELERTKGFGQDIFIVADSTNGIGEKEGQAIKTMKKLSRDGFEKFMSHNKLDAMVTLGTGASSVLAIGGYPAITVPAGYDSTGIPFGILFSGLRGTEPKLIEIAYAFEQATLCRKPPSFESFDVDFKAV